jgi:hypothetical protein
MAAEGPMIRTRASRDPFNWRERVTATMIVVGLALPFIPVPGDGMARMKAVRLDEATTHPVKVTTQAPRSVCEVLAFSLAYENPETGAYTRVACKVPQ